MSWRDALFLGCLLILSVAVLAVAHYLGDPAWLETNLPSAEGGDSALWQVHATFVSVGFAGLAIAAQLFAEAPLAVGASRGRVLDHVWAGWFAGVGLVGNVVIAIETVWLPSGLGLIGIALIWFFPTIGLLVVSTLRLVDLFGHPSRLDEVVRSSLVGSISRRLEIVALTYGEARTQLEGLVSAQWEIGGHSQARELLRVPVPEVGRVIKSIKPRVVRRALDTLGPRAIESGSVDGGSANSYSPPSLTLGAEPGDRTRLGDTAFRITTDKKLDPQEQKELVRLLQSSIEFEGPGAVTPDEDTDREIATIKDAIGINVRSGALSTAERAVELLGDVIKGAWLAGPEAMTSSRRASLTRRDWLFSSLGEVEQDALLSPRVAGLFVGAAMSRALESPRTGSSEYVDECLRSFTRIWLDVLRHGGPEFAHIPERIVVCIQNLAAYSRSDADVRQDLPTRATWTLVELVKLALDAKKTSSALRAAEELDGLFQFADQDGQGRAHVRAGQLVLTGWLYYLRDKKDNRDPSSSELCASVAPNGTRAEIIAARALTERGVVPFSKWDWWEMRVTGSARAQSLELSSYVDEAELDALASAYGPLPPAEEQEVASEYKRLLRLLDERQSESSSPDRELKELLERAVDGWDAAEDGRLARAPLSESKIALLKDALRSVLRDSPSLADQIPVVDEVPEFADASRPILGLNFRVPRHFFVDDVFHHTYADPRQLGELAARAFTDAEDQRVLDLLRSLSSELREPNARAIAQEIGAIGFDSSHWVLATPFGGLTDLDGWYSAEFRESLARVVHIETAILDDEAILFDPRSSLVCSRSFERKEGLDPVEGTSIALGIFQDVDGGDEPKVRVETGEYFVVWAGDQPAVLRFGVAGETSDAGSLSEPSPHEYDSSGDDH